MASESITKLRPDPAPALLTGAILMTAGYLLPWFRRSVAAEPGTAVIVHGRTAAYPVEPSPLAGRDCVWYEVLTRRTKVISSNYEETTTAVEATWGDLAVYDERDVRMPVTAELGARPILATSSPLVGEFTPGAPSGGNSDYTTTSERLVEPGRSVVVTGVVRPDGTLGRGAWADGSAHCATPEHVFRRHARFERWTVGVAAALILAAVTVTFVAG